MRHINCLFATNASVIPTAKIFVGKGCKAFHFWWLLKPLVILAVRITSFSFLERKSSRSRGTNEMTNDSHVVILLWEVAVVILQQITMSSDRLGYENTLSLSTSRLYIVRRNGRDDLSLSSCFTPLRRMIDDSSWRYFGNAKVHSELIRTDR